jgi:hypothetical protein
MPSILAARPVETARAAAVALLLAVAAYGVRALGAGHLIASAPARLPSGPFLTAFVVVEAAAAVLVVAAIGVGLRRPRRRQPDSFIVVEPIVGRWARPVGLGVALVALVLPLSLLVLVATRTPTGSARRPVPVPPPVLPSPTVSTAPVGSPDASPAGSSPLWPLLAVAVIVTAAAGLIVLSRSTRPQRSLPKTPATPLTSSGERRHVGDLAALGTRALLSVDDPRAAVLACYVAMEDALAEVGAAPAPYDTSTEVLARGSRCGQVDAEAARTLTGLFQEARYSVHSVGEEHREAALAALDQLRPGSAENRGRS